MFKDSSACLCVCTHEREKLHAYTKREREREKNLTGYVFKRCSLAAPDARKYEPCNCF